MRIMYVSHFIMFLFFSHYYYFDTYRCSLLIERWTQWFRIKCHYKHQWHVHVNVGVDVDVVVVDGVGVDADDAPLFFVYSLAVNWNCIYSNLLCVCRRVIVCLVQSVIDSCYFSLLQWHSRTPTKCDDDFDDVSNWSLAIDYGAHVSTFFFVVVKSENRRLIDVITINVV